MSLHNYLTWFTNYIQMNYVLNKRLQTTCQVLVLSLSDLGDRLSALHKLAEWEEKNITLLQNKNKNVKQKRGPDKCKEESATQDQDKVLKLN